MRNELSVVNAREHMIAEPCSDDWDIYAYDWYRPVRVYPSASDPVIKQRIECQFFWSPFVDGEDIEVHVEDGMVVLEGTADSAKKRAAATENALQGGAARVDSDPAIDPG